VEAVITYLDTHVVVFLRTRPFKTFPGAARRAIDRASDLRISPVVILELQMLFEIGRLASGPSDFVDPLTEALSLRVCDLPFERVARAAEECTWTRDPIDRLIVAQSIAARGALITKDQTLRDHYARAVWD
jgi:PIN domain nuclease of toxin-antitoxin system